MSQQIPDAPKLGTRRIKLYTKKGDNGKTYLFDGNRHSKSEPVFSVLGDLDELNCAIGMLIAQWGVHYSVPVDKQFFRKIQRRIINISSLVATPGPKGEKLVKITDEDIEKLEQEIDRCHSLAPKLTQFILPCSSSCDYDHSSIPGMNHIMLSEASLASAQAHVCRALTRRAERNVLGLWNQTRVEGHPNPNEVSIGVSIGFIKPISRSEKERNTLIYLNRLSDFFFAYSRAVVAHFKYLGLREVTME